MDWITIPDNQDQAPAEYTSKWGQAKKVTFCTQRAFCRQPPTLQTLILSNERMMVVGEVQDYWGRWGQVPSFITQEANLRMYK